MTRSDFAVFILSHGRAKNVLTYHALMKLNYTGKIYILLDNEDEQEQEYREIYGDKVIVFDKKEMASRTDACDNFNQRQVILYARNACYEVARKLGLKYFLQLDDDYTQFDYRRHRYYKLKNHFEAVCDTMIEFLECSPNILTVAFFQGGDVIGGYGSRTFQRGYRFKAMNTLFCKTDDYVKFKGTMNEDCTRYVTQNAVGKLSISTSRIQVTPKSTQSMEGGITDLYKKYGTYVKSFYTVMNCPAAVKVSVMMSKHARIHHHVNFDDCTVKIIDEKYKKV